MSYDLGVWYPFDRLSDAEAGELYAKLCEGNDASVLPHPAVDVFYRDLTLKHPEIYTVADDKIDDHDYCPWSCALDRSPGHVSMACVWSKADYVDVFVRDLAHKHGLAVFDPQLGTISYPDSVPSVSDGRKSRGSRPWWRSWRRR